MKRSENISNTVFQDHHLIKSQQIYFLNRLNNKEINDIFIAENLALASFVCLTTKSCTGNPKQEFFNKSH